MHKTEKTVKDSYTEQVQILTQANINGYNRLFGGQLMEWIDVVAAVVARRHAGHNVTTAVVDTLTFQAPAHPNDTLLLCGNLTHVGRSSMEVCVRTYVENLDGSRLLINTAYLVMVALDEQERPVLCQGCVWRQRRNGQPGRRQKPVSSCGNSGWGRRKSMSDHNYLRLGFTANSSGIQCFGTASSCPSAFGTSVGGTGYFSALFSAKGRAWQTISCTISGCSYQSQSLQQSRSMRCRWCGR